MMYNKKVVYIYSDWLSGRDWDNILVVLGPNVEPGVPNLYFIRALHQVSPFLTFGRLVEGRCKVPLVLRLSKQIDRTGGKCVQSPFGA